MAKPIHDPVSVDVKLSRNSRRAVFREWWQSHKTGWHLHLL